jgi:hypothetical protein
MDVRTVGMEAMKYAATGFAGLGIGAVLGQATGVPPMNCAVVCSAAFIACRAFDQFARKNALSRDWELSTFQIVKSIGWAMIGMTAAVSLFALGVLSTKSLFVMAALTAAFSVINISLGVYIKYSGDDDLLEDIVMNDKTSWHVRFASARY